MLYTIENEELRHIYDFYSDFLQKKELLGVQILELEYKSMFVEFVLYVQRSLKLTIKETK